MEEEYRLLTKTKETISIVKCHSFEEAIEYFANKKRLSIDALLSIFEVGVSRSLPSGGTSR